MFESVTQVWNNLSTMHKALVGIALVVLLYFAYGWYQKRQMATVPSSVPQMEYYNDNTQASGDTLNCTMYYVDWCKFCKKAKPEWQQLEQEYNGKVVNGKKILVTSINCDENEDVAERENIKGYPTFKFNMKGKYFDYPDEPTFDKFKTFIEYLVGQE